MAVVFLVHPNVTHLVTSSTGPVSVSVLVCPHGSLVLPPYTSCAATMAGEAASAINELRKEFSAQLAAVRGEFEAQLHAFAAEAKAMHETQAAVTTARLETMLQAMQVLSNRQPAGGASACAAAPTQASDAASSSTTNATRGGGRGRERSSSHFHWQASEYSKRDMEMVKEDWIDTSSTEKELKITCESRCCTCIPSSVQ